LLNLSQSYYNRKLSESKGESNVFANFMKKSQ